VPSRKGVFFLRPPFFAACPVRRGGRGDNLFFFTQRRKGAKPQRGLDLRGSPSLRAKKQKLKARNKPSILAHAFKSLVP